MILNLPFGGLDTSKSNVASGGGSVQCGPCPQGGGMVETTIQTVDVAPTTNDPILVLAAPNPLPNVARHVVQAEGVGFERLDRTGGPPPVLGLVLPGEVPAAPQVGVLLGRLSGLVLAPRVQRPVVRTEVAGAGGGLPLAFARKAFADPFAVFGGVPVRDMNDRVIFAVFVRGSGSLGVAPVCLICSHPVFGFWINLCILQLFSIRQEGAEHE
mmetsp:Transcript_53/g.125  ORF Transcript_53/g.125 Transcript_53/m.125 type:complete len:213 (+) Transcript_53:1249-1887(+)